MATLEELEQLKLAEQGNQEIRDTQRVQDYFNAYKRTNNRRAVFW